MTVPYTLSNLFYAFVVLSLVWVSSASALTCKLTIEPPVEWNDGHPAVLDDIAAYYVYTSSCKTCVPDAPIAAFATDAMSNPARPVLVIPGCQRRQWWRVSAVDQFGGEGLLSPPFFLRR